MTHCTTTDDVLERSTLDNDSGSIPCHTILSSHTGYTHRSLFLCGCFQQQRTIFSLGKMKFGLAKISVITVRCSSTTCMVRQKCRVMGSVVIIALDICIVVHHRHSDR